ncbi:MAG: Excinuclease ABC subunit C [uncultured bacterium]|nr:MAG: Excinuclease ABC subunit C [uncultured bacterium]
MLRVVFDFDRMDIHSKNITTLPHTCGVYLYKNKNGVIIYVGKAIDIQKRVKQYFVHSSQLSSKTNQLVMAIAAIDHIKTISEFDAILLEAKLISTYQPKYNMIAKDDKSPIYIRIPLHDKLPIVSLVRKSNGNIGPFQSTRVAKQILSTIRKIVPFCCQKIHKGKRCFYTHLELCNPCPSDIMMFDESKKQKFTKIYRKNIFILKHLLNGKAIGIRKKLNRTMLKYAKANDFEQAASMRNQIQNLDNLLQTHFDPSLYTTISNDIGNTISNELNDLKQILAPYYVSIQTLHRIEGMDISQTSGAHAVGSLVVLDNGIMNTSLYRKFAIRNILGQNDTEMIRQVMTRRLAHKEWIYPDLFIVDGGKAQVAAASSCTEAIPIIGLAKKFERIIVNDNGTYKELHIPITRPGIHVLQRIRDESHRFAHSYHQLKRKKAFLNEI